MGRTLLGVDLDESHVGGLVKRLLTDEELEKLADGGRPATDGGDTDDDNSSDDTADDEATGDEAAGESETDESDQETGVAGGDTSSDRTSGPSDDVGPTGSVGSTGPVGSPESEFGFDDRGLTPGEDDSEGRLGGYGPLAVKGGVVLLALVVVALVVWRYGGKIKSVLPFVGGSGESDESDLLDEESTDTAVEEDVSPARRRAKVGARDDSDDSGTTGSDSRDDLTEDENEERDVRSVGEDVDLGALVGLGTLALIAALVRKFGEQRERDPLVDGPEE